MKIECQNPLYVSCEIILFIVKFNGKHCKSHILQLGFLQDNSCNLFKFSFIHMGPVPKGKSAILAVFTEKAFGNRYVNLFSHKFHPSMHGWMDGWMDGDHANTTQKDKRKTQKVSKSAK